MTIIAAFLFFAFLIASVWRLLEPRYKSPTTDNKAREILRRRMGLDRAKGDK